MKYIESIDSMRRRNNIERSRAGAAGGDSAKSAEATAAGDGEHDAATRDGLAAGLERRKVRTHHLITIMLNMVNLNNYCWGIFNLLNTAGTNPCLEQTAYGYSHEFVPAV